MNNFGSCSFFPSPAGAKKTLNNIGTGEDIAIADLARLIADIVDFNGDIRFDADKPHGTPRKWLDISHLRNLGWRHRIELRQGVQQTFEAYKGGRL